MLTCAICGIESREVTIRLIHWADPEEMPEYSADPRCKDMAACQGRVVAKGEKWPVVESKKEAVAP